MLKEAFHAGGERFPPCKGLPLLLEVHLGNSLLAGGLLQLQAPSMQRLGEFIELLPADLESLAASLELRSLGRKADLLLGNGLLLLLQGFLLSRRRELPVEHLSKPFSVGLKVGLKLGPGGGGTGGLGLRALLQADVPVAEVLTLAL